MQIILTVIHVVVCLILVVIVLLQHGKGADMGAAFGGSGQTLFGTEGPLPLLNKITTSGAILFMITSLGLAYLSSHQTKGSVMKNIKPVAPISQPAASSAPVPVTVPLEKSAEGQAAPSQFPGAPASEEKQAPPAPAAGTEGNR